MYDTGSLPLGPEADRNIVVRAAAQMVSRSRLRRNQNDRIAYGDVSYGRKASGSDNVPRTNSMSDCFFIVCFGQNLLLHRYFSRNRP